MTYVNSSIRESGV